LLNNNIIGGRYESAKYSHTILRREKAVPPRGYRWANPTGRFAKLVGEEEGHG
jgi:hypothetical protein